jgi:hypothetical protein
MSVECYDCGKKYKAIQRTRYEEDSGGSWISVPVCQKCWDGIILVPDDDDLHCDDCGEMECPISEQINDQWREQMEAAILHRYPCASVVFLPSADVGTYHASHRNAAGIEECPQSIVWAVWSDIDFNCDECPNKAVETD